MSKKYGFVVTDSGRELIAKLVAGETLNISRVMVGTGSVEHDINMEQLTDLVEPVALGTSTKPQYNGASVSMTVEYRSDLNGGLDHGFWLNEFGVFAYDPDKGEVLIYYGTLGDYPQYVSAISDTGVDVRRFPICIIIGEDVGVTVDYKCEAWMTAEDVSAYCASSVLPGFLEESGHLIAAHNNDPEAHQDIRGSISAVDSRLALLELLLNTNVTGNPFVVTFQTIDGVSVEGVWNESEKRVEF